MCTAIWSLKRGLPDVKIHLSYRRCESVDSRLELGHNRVNVVRSLFKHDLNIRNRALNKNRVTLTIRLGRTLKTFIKIALRRRVS